MLRSRDFNRKVLRSRDFNRKVSEVEISREKCSEVEISIEKFPIEQYRESRGFNRKVKRK